MAHKIMQRDVQVGKTMAWHGKTRIKSVINKDTCEIAYPMELQQVQLPSGDKIDFYAVVSLDDGKIVGKPIGTRYAMVSNAHMLDMIETSLAGTSHEIVSIGTVQDRSMAFASIKLDDEFMAGGRATEAFFNIIWGHGGIFQVTAKTCLNVVVCWNTVMQALRHESQDFQFDFKHTGDTVTKLENMGKAIEAHCGVVAEFKQAMDSLANQSCNTNRMERIATGFMVRSDNTAQNRIATSLIGNAIATKAQNRIARVVELYKTGNGNNGKTMADAFNALTDFYSHESSGGDDRWKQYESSEFGSGMVRKSEAYELFTGRNVIGLGDMNTVEARGAKLLMAN